MRLAVVLEHPGQPLPADDACVQPRHRYHRDGGPKAITQQA